MRESFLRYYSGIQNKECYANYFDCMLRFRAFRCLIDEELEQNVKPLIKR